MSLNPTSIEWTHVFGPGSGHTWNPITGCTKGCYYCYARRLVETRLAHLYPNGFEPTFWANRLDDVTPRQKPKGIFVGSMGDMWDPNVPQEWRDAVWQRMRECPQHVYLTLTKQPRRVDPHEQRLWLDYIWHGVTATRQRELVPWEWREDFDFVSVEPMLGPICLQAAGFYMDWLIIGADSRPDADPNIPQKGWVEHLVADAEHACIPVLAKNNLTRVMGEDWVAEHQQWPEQLQQHRR